MISPYTAPCKDCPYRDIGCHINCPDYKAYKQTRSEMNAKSYYDSLDNSYSLKKRHERRIKKEFKYKNR